MPTQSVPVSPAADHQHVLVFGVDRRPSAGAVKQPTGVGGEIFHRLVDAVQLAAGNRQVARLGGPAAQHDGVKLLAQVGSGQVAANLHAGMKLDAGTAHQVDAAIHQGLLQLHVRNAVHQQSADAVGTLVHGNQVAGAVELIGACQARGAGPDYRDPLAGTANGPANEMRPVRQNLVQH